MARSQRHGDRDISGGRAHSRPAHRAAPIVEEVAAQLDIEEKARMADVVVDNTGAPDTLAAKAAMLHADLLRGLGKKAPGADARWY